MPHEKTAERAGKERGDNLDEPSTPPSAAL